MRKMLVFLTAIVLTLAAQIANAVTVYYQPTPYPTPNQSGTHVWGGWLNNSYNQTLVVDQKYQVGGWGDQYRTFIKLDLTGLPQNVDQAYLWLMPYSRGDGSMPIPYAVCPAMSGWDLSVTWNTQPSYGSCWGWYAAPTAGSWSGFWLSVAGGPDWYNSWKNGTLANNGIMLFPQATNNNFDVFYSTQHNDYALDPYADARRPQLQLTFTPTIQLKMPLPGNHSWLVTTEVGGYDCKGNYDQYHADVTGNYFSIDFGWGNIPDSGATVYAETSNIPVLAAAGGQIVFAGKYDSPDPRADNGYYVVINHNGYSTESPGYTTRYLHMKAGSLVVSAGQTVAQGALLGYMGNTGLSFGTHLHFGVRYNNSGLSSVPELAKVVMDGWLLKSFQTECSGGNWIRYYRSGNTVY